ncbi:MAG: sulfotransferase [Proteobacteria bacterium]|nr:sulfotransferase [Pseudomonadota bacterium]
MRRVVLISGLQRSGTTLLQRLCDGHPDLWVHPSEAIFAGNKYQWPDLENAVRLRHFNTLFEHRSAIPVLDLFFSSRLGKLTQNLAEENPDFDFDFDRFLADWRGALAGHETWSEGLVLEEYLASFFRNLRSHPRRDSSFYLIKTPRLGFQHRRFFELFPTGGLIFVRRDPAGYIASELQRLVRPPSRLRHRLRRLKGIYQFARLSAFAEGLYRELAGHPRVLILPFEELVAETAPTMRRVADFIGVRFNAILTVPTLYERPWRSNSSYAQGVKGAIDGAPLRRAPFSGVEAAFLGACLRLLPRAAAATVLNGRPALRDPSSARLSTPSPG